MMRWLLHSSCDKELAKALIDYDRALKMLEQEKAVVKRTLAEVTEQKAINDYVVHDKDQLIEVLNKQIADLRSECQKLQDKRSYNDTIQALHTEIAVLKDKIDVLTRRNDELEEWGKRLAIEATQELTGNKPVKVNCEKLESQWSSGESEALKKRAQDKTIKDIWESGNLSKLKVVEKNRGPVNKKAVKVNKWA